MENKRREEIMQLFK